METKKGITMLILIVTIVLSAIILSVSIVAINNITKNSSLTAFREEITNIEGAIKEYYTFNSELPMLYTKKYSIDEISALSSNADEFKNEVQINGEDESTSFYKVDLGKLEFDKTIRGTARSGENDNDVYVVAYPSFNVYYLKGIKVKKVYYFSNSSKISDTKIDSKEDEEVSKTYTSGDLTVKKETNRWTNQLGIEISTFIDSNNSLYINALDKLGNVVEKKLDTKAGQSYNKKINNLTDVGFSAAESQAFCELSQDKKTITIIKKSLTEEVGKIELDMSNYETTLPVVSDNTSISSYDKYNEITISLKDGTSGLKELRYEYYKKDNGYGETLFLESENDYSVENILKSGKIIKLNGSEQIVSIKLPKNVTSIKYVVVDNALNSTNLIEISTKTPIFIGYQTIAGTESSITFNANVTTTNTVTAFKTEVSTDGEKYQKKNLKNHGAVKNISDVTYTGLENVKDYIYVRITVTCGTVNEVRIIQVDASNFFSATNFDGRWDSDEEINIPKVDYTGLIPVYYNSSTKKWVELTISSTKDEWDNWYNYDTKNWANAITKDSDGNITGYFVWIPRYEYKIDDENKTIDVKFINVGATPDDGYIIHPAFTTDIENGGWDKELQGFWVAKYAAGYQYGQEGKTVGEVKYSNLVYTSINSASPNNFYGKIAVSSTKISYPVFTPLTYAYNNISASDVFLISREVENAKDMYNLKNINSHMMKNSEWGAVSYLAHSKYGLNGNASAMNEIVPNNKTLSNSIYVKNGTSGDKAYIYAVTGYSSTNTAEGVSSSTTKNMTGVFDMSGCLNERTAGYFKGGSASTPVWNNAIATSATSESTKYVTLYTVDNKKGDAMNETKGWNSDWYEFITSVNPVTTRGGGYSYGISTAGIFFIGLASGWPAAYNGFRICLAF